MQFAVGINRTLNIIKLYFDNQSKAKGLANAFVGRFHLVALRILEALIFTHFTLLSFHFANQSVSIHHSNVQTDFVQKAETEKLLSVPDVALHCIHILRWKHCTCKLANIFHSKLTSFCLASISKKERMRICGRV